jgi:hypothetical protein
MSTRPSIVGRRATLLIFLVGTVAAVLFLVPPPPAHAFICANGYPIYDTIYFNNASHSKVVGSCAQSCSGQVTCTGTKSAYSIRVETGCCSF